jgi:hypothetical protein
VIGSVASNGAYSYQLENVMEVVDSDSDACYAIDDSIEDLRRRAEKIRKLI